MITRDYWRLSNPGNFAYYGPLAEMTHCRHHTCKLMKRAPEDYTLSLVPCCACCGALLFEKGEEGATGPYRCDKHAERNPCMIEGCTRTRAAPIHEGSPYLRDDQTVCAEHWRRFVPPGSRARRAYHAHFRRAKRKGWTMANSRAFDRFWDTLVLMVRRRAVAGHIDEAEINRIMGW